MGQVAAVASKSLERAQAFAQEQHIPAGYGSYQEMLQPPGHRRGVHRHHQQFPL